MKRNLTRKEKRAFDRMKLKPKYQKIAKRIIESKNQQGE